jgi:hypothetical protein
MPPYFIDFEAFRYKKNNYIIKELAMLDVNKPLVPLYYVFKNVKPWSALTLEERMQFTFLSKYIHHLTWCEGTSRFCADCIWYHLKLLFPDCESGITYVMGGGEKLKFLQELFPKLRLVQYNITFKSLPMIAPSIQCLHRQHGEHCAYRKTLRLFHHYITLPE